jgi:hypothetical protein
MRPESFKIVKECNYSTNPPHDKSALRQRTSGTLSRLKMRELPHKSIAPCKGQSEALPSTSPEIHWIAGIVDK